MLLKKMTVVQNVKLNDLMAKCKVLTALTYNNF